MTGKTDSSASKTIRPQDAVAFRPALIWSFCRKLRDVNDVNDVKDFVQKVFLRIAARQCGKVESLGGYVFQIAASTSTGPVKTILGVDNWWRLGMVSGTKAQHDRSKAFSQTEFTKDMKAITVPVLVMHSENDQIVPFVDSGPLSAKLLQNATLKVYRTSTRHADDTGADHQCRFAGLPEGIAPTAGQDGAPVDIRRRATTGARRWSS